MPSDITLVQPTPKPTGTGLSPQMPQEAPAAVKAMTFSVDPDYVGQDATVGTVKIDGQVVKEDNSNASDGIKPVVEATKKTDEPVKEAKKEEPPKKEELKSVVTMPADLKKEEVKVDKTTTKAADKLPISPITLPDKGVDKFDYTKYSPQEQGNLRKMANEVKVEYARLLDENKQLSSLKDATYLQHEQGYTLSPDYQQLAQKSNFAMTEGQVWEQALLNIKAGKPFKPITAFDKNGNPVLGAEIQPTDQHEIQVTNNLQACIAESRRLSGELNSYPSRFKNQVSQDLATIQQVQREKFFWEADPKLLDATVEVEGQGEQKIRDIQSGFRSMFPPYLANTPGVQVAANVMVAMIIQGAELRQLRNTSQIATIKAQEMARGEPTSDNSPTQTLAKKDEKGRAIPVTFNLDGLPTS